MRIITLPMGWQPAVGQDISMSISGRVVGVAIDPLGSEQILVDIELRDTESDDRGHWDIPVQVGVGGGNT